MSYRKNVGSKEGWARVLGGALIVACSLTLIGTTPLGWVFAASGVFTANCASTSCGGWSRCPRCTAR